MIAFAVTDEVIEILGIYYGGRDYESLLRTSKEWLGSQPGGE